MARNKMIAVIARVKTPALLAHQQAAKLSLRLRQVETPFRSCAGVGGRGGGHGRGLIVAVAAAEPGDAPNGDVSAGGDERYAAPNPRGA